MKVVVQNINIVIQNEGDMDCKHIHRILIMLGHEFRNPSKQNEMS